MTIARELLTILGFDLNETGFKRAEDGFESLIGLATEIVDRVARVGKAFLEVALDTAAAGDEALAGAQRAGLGVEEYQRLAFAAEQSNASARDLEIAMRTLANTSEEATRRGGAASRVFSALGVSTRDANGQVRSGVDFFIDIVEALKNVENPTLRAAYAQDVFGRSAQRLKPLIEEGREGVEALMRRADELGFVLDERTARAGDRLNDTIQQLNRAIEGLKNRLGTALIPVVQRIVDVLIKFIERFRALDVVVAVTTKLVVAIGDALADLLEWVVKNQRFIYILTGVVATFAAVLGLSLIPSILASITALAIWISEWIAAAAPILAVVAGLVLIALIIEDLVAFMTGRKSLIGDFFDEFLKRPAGVDDHWAVKVIRTILSAVDTAIKRVGTLAQVLAAIVEGNYEDVGPLIEFGRTAADQAEFERTGIDRRTTTGPVRLTRPRASRTLGDEFRERLRNAPQTPPPESIFGFRNVGREILALARKEKSEVTYNDQRQTNLNITDESSDESKIARIFQFIEEALDKDRQRTAEDLSKTGSR